MASVFFGVGSLTLDMGTCYLFDTFCTTRARILYKIALRTPRRYPKDSSFWVKRSRRVPNYGMMHLPKTYKLLVL